MKYYIYFKSKTDTSLINVDYALTLDFIKKISRELSIDIDKTLKFIMFDKYETNLNLERVDGCIDINYTDAYLYGDVRFDLILSKKDSTVVVDSNGLSPFNKYCSLDYKVEYKEYLLFFKKIKSIELVVKVDYEKMIRDWICDDCKSGYYIY